jgi:hypothetical protein
MLLPVLLFLMQSDPAMQPARVIVNPGEQYAAAARPWQGIPTLERTRKGRLWAAW